VAAPVCNRLGFPLAHCPCQSDHPRLCNLFRLGFSVVCLLYIYLHQTIQSSNFRRHTSLQILVFSSHVNDLKRSLQLVNIRSVNPYPSIHYLFRKRAIYSPFEDLKLCNFNLQPEFRWKSVTTLTLICMPKKTIKYVSCVSYA
jgi:hypothetical protein